MKEQTKASLHIAARPLKNSTGSEQANFTESIYEKFHNLGINNL